MTSYIFSFPVEAAGLNISITNAAGDEIATATLGSTPNESDVLIHAAELDAGNYTATVELATAGITNRQSAVWEMDEDELRVTGIVAPNGVGASETAYFVATGPTSVTDGAHHELTLTARETLPEWVSVEDGEAVLSQSAGGVFVSIIGQTDLDFSDTTPAPAEGNIGAAYKLKHNGSDIATVFAPDPTSGDGTDNQELGASEPAGDFAFGGTISVTASAFAGTDGYNGDITDAVASHTVAVNITRLSPTPTLP